MTCGCLRATRSWWRRPSASAAATCGRGSTYTGGAHRWGAGRARWWRAFWGAAGALLWCRWGAALGCRRGAGAQAGRCGGACWWGLGEALLGRCWGAGGWGLRAPGGALVARDCGGPVGCWWCFGSGLWGLNVYRWGALLGRQQGALWGAALVMLGRWCGGACAAARLRPASPADSVTRPAGLPTATRC